MMHYTAPRGVPAGRGRWLLALGWWLALGWLLARGLRSALGGAGRSTPGEPPTRPRRPRPAHRARSGRALLPYPAA